VSDRLDKIISEHRKCGTPRGYDGCYSHWPTPHCRADGMALPCDVMQIAEALFPDADTERAVRLGASWPGTIEDDIAALPAAEAFASEAALTEAIAVAHQMGFADGMAAERSRLADERLVALERARSILRADAVDGAREPMWRYGVRHALSVIGAHVPGERVKENPS
jgi:hypothetical protein